MGVGFVLLNGAGLGAWIWRDVVPCLDLPVIALEYPGRGESGGSTRGLRLADYAAHVARQVEEWRVERVVVVAHSIGAVVAREAAASLGQRVAGFVAIGAAIPKRGRSFLSTLPFPQRRLMPLVLRIVGTRPPAGAIKKGLCSDLPPALADEVVARFVPEARRLYSDPVNAAVPDVPRLYVRLTEDREFAPALQDEMARAMDAEVVNLPMGHLPMLRAPDALAAALNEFAKGAVP